MINTEETIVIDRPVEEVFAYVADQTNAPGWQAGLLEVKRLTDGPIGVGTKHTIVRTFMGRRMEASNEYFAYEVGKQISFRSTSGPASFEATYRFESSAGRTRLTSRIEMDAKGFVRLAEPLIARSLRREVRSNLVTLKNLLESRVVVQLQIAMADDAR